MLKTIDFVRALLEQKGKLDRFDPRVVWSNDGLIFVTYDHYATFYAIE